MSKLALVLAIQFAAVLAQVQFRVIRQWRYLNFTWPNPDALRRAMASGEYTPENVVAAGISYHADWFYLTMPRMKDGVPATLGRITAISGGSTAPRIEPFPSWEFNAVGDCNALQNVQNVEIDAKGQMWIIDGGHVASLADRPVKNCPPKLLIYDLAANATVARYVFPEDVAKRNDSFLYDLVVDGDFAYITDNGGDDPGIIVFSLRAHRSWKIRHAKTMRGDPAARNFKVGDVAVDSLINVAGIALGPKMQRAAAPGVVVNQDREVFYCPLSSTHLYSISTSILQSEGNSNNGQDYPGEVRDVGIKASQTDGMIMTNRGVLYYGLLGDNSVAEWDSRTPFASGQKVVSRDPNFIQWANSFAIDLEGRLALLSNTLQKFIYGRLDLRQYNFWLLSGQIEGKSYLYDDPSLAYEPATDATPVRAPSAKEPPKTPEPKKADEVEADKSREAHTPDGGGGSRRALEISAILVSIMALLLCRRA